MAVLTKLPLTAAGVAVALGCSPIDVSLFGDSESDTGVDDPDTDPGSSSDGLGGAAPGEDEPDLLSELVLDDFEDGDEKANDPAGWWYLVGDGTGKQSHSVVIAEDLPVGGSLANGLTWRVFSQGTTEWGAVWGVDIGEAAFVGPALELSFTIAASRDLTVSFHALDGSNEHFVRDFSCSSEWSRVTIRLDELRSDSDSGSLIFDVATATELQWFINGDEETSVWLDNVVLRSF